MKMCLLVLSIYSINACSSKRDLKLQTLKTGEENYVILLNDSNINILEEKTMIIESQQELLALYDQINATRTTNIEIPVVNFKTQCVILAAMGQKSTGGFQVTGVKMEAINENTIYTFSTTSPGPDDLVTMSMTTPGMLLLANQPFDKIIVRVNDKIGNQK
jgi:hypothetical protein